MKSVVEKSLSILLVSLLAIGILSQVVSALYQSPNPWPAWRYDQMHNGYTVSSVTDRNATVWDTTNYLPTTPIVVDGRVIFGGTSYRVYALDEISGVELWRSTSLAGSLTGNPSYSNGRVFVTSSNGYVYCINATDGTKLWENQVTSTGQIQSAPTVANGRVYVTTTDNYLFGCDVTTGSYDVWYYQAANKIYSSPAVYGNMVYFGCDDGKIYALDTSNPGGFVQIWRFQTAGSVRSSPCVADGKLFIGSSNSDHSVFALNATTTTPSGELIWKYTLDTGYSVDVTPAYHNGVVYFTFYSGKIYALNANASPGNYTENQPGCKLYSQTIGSGNYGVGYYSPTVASNRVVASDGSTRIYCLNGTTLQPIWSSAFGNNVYEPIVADGNVFVNDYYGLHCIGDFYPAVTYDYTVTPPGAGGQSYSIELTIANATPSQTINTQLLASQFKINYTVAGIDGTIGMSSLTIDDNMLVGPYTVRVNGGLIPSPIVSDNGTFTTITFNYFQSTNEILIEGTDSIVPEFSPLTLLTSVLIASGIVAFAARSNRLRKHHP